MNQIDIAKNLIQISNIIKFLIENDSEQIAMEKEIDNLISVRNRLYKRLNDDNKKSYEEWLKKKINKGGVK